MAKKNKADRDLALARELMDLVLSGAPNGEIAKSVKAVVDNRVVENTWLEVKSGQWLETEEADPDGAVLNSREHKFSKYTAGFANSDGGVLVVGVSEVEKATGFAPPKWEVDGVPDGISEAQVADYTRRIKQYLHPEPRFRVVDIDGKSVVVVAVERSYSITPCIVRQAPRFYHRFWDSTIPIPPHLESDLFLGTRRHPSFGVTVSGGVKVWVGGVDSDTGQFRVRIPLSLCNETLVWARQENTLQFLVGYLEDRPPVPATLRAEISVDGTRPTSRLGYFAVSGPPLYPLTAVDTSVDVLFRSCIPTIHEKLLWTGGFGLLVQGHRVQWFALRVWISGSPLRGGEPHAVAKVSPVPEKVLVPVSCRIC